ncbi:SemiSWEET transporter [Ferrovibrio sp.]|uniref:SemiSWEET transporter n=1 Tax=Ferrovibrio sp. TaxID=1917215 RepID=UPI0025B8A226|nr:SemiSWEET transporter [Ferrovibrio sp.]MBX3455355.1 SemiSWEET family sugar transporter [Ferrovibrio sp.]
MGNALIDNAVLFEAVGLLAGTLTTVAYLPQVIQVWRTRSARDISLGMFLLMVSGISLWLIYGLMIGSVALIAANSVTLVLTMLVLIGKLKYGR